MRGAVVAAMQPRLSLLFSEGPCRERLSSGACPSGDAKQPDPRRESGQKPMGLEVWAAPTGESSLPGVGQGLQWGQGVERALLPKQHFLPQVVGSVWELQGAQTYRLAS